MTELKMPRLTDSMEQGTILTWLKAEGEQVLEGEDLLEIETDKATVTHPAEATGVLQIVAGEGTTLPVGATIARLGLVGVTAVAAPRSEANRSQSAVSIAAPPNGNVGLNEAGVRATPLARRVARMHGVRLEDVAGSGPLGRVTRTDVLTKAGIPGEPARVRPRPVAQPAGDEPGVQPIKGTVEVVEPTRIQALIARRMAEAKATVPHFQVQTEVVMDAAVAFREQLKCTGATAPSLNDLIVKAVGLALRKHPLANGSYRDGRLEFHSRVNIGIAVAADQGLLVPTIFDADQKSLGTIAAEARRLAERVRSRGISPAELGGATFTVSNLGMYGMTSITPVINPPQAAILGVGAVREVLARADGEIVDKRLMTVTLSCDHRILYGAVAAEFLSDIRDLLEQVLRLAL